MWRLSVLLLTLAGLASGGWWWFSRPRLQPIEYRTTAVRRGDIQAVVSATGTLEPEELVDVGAQVAGRILELGRDPQHDDKPVDYGTQVDEGTVLARLDSAIYSSQVEQNKASLQRARAEAQQQRIRLEQLEREWNRAQNFRKSQSISESDLDVARTNWQMAQASVDLAEAGLELARAALHESEINLGYTTIRSPVRGVIIDRRVNVGQTVVASLNAPSLFLIAKDLRRLQVWASVNEADIAQIHLGQPVRFTVDARPQELFRGQVEQIRLNATMTQNVVTYTVVVATDNTELKLLPYLTANLQFERDTRTGVLLVPNSALRWKPRVANGNEAESRASQPARGTAPTSPPTPGPGTAGPGSASRGRVYVRDGSGVRSIEVTVGLSDGAQTEVTGEGLSEGLEVVVADQLIEKPTVGSPFAPATAPRSATGGAAGGR
ncbi:MAG: efflux RND transporter periplasmic adaptor subunit [Planctomycetaceae bacterium]